MQPAARFLLLSVLLCSVTCAARQRGTDPTAAAPAPPASLSTPPESTDSDAGRFVSPVAEQYFGEYARTVRSRIEERYVRTVQDEYDGGFGKATVSFLIEPDGTIADLQTAQVAGDDRFEELCRTVVSTAGPFDPIPYDAAHDLPVQFKNEPIGFRLQFEFAPDTPTDQWTDSATLPQEPEQP